MQTRFKFTEASVSRAAVPTGSKATAFYWDTEVRGFGLRVGQTGARSFIAQRDIRGRTRRVTLGKWPTFRVAQAREWAREQVFKMACGEDPAEVRRAEEARGVTLDAAIEMHASAMRAKRCAPKSISSIREELDRHAADWMARPLASLTRNECAERHERITREAGPYAANRVMTSLRACYNTAARRFEELSDRPPTVGVTFNEVRRRREPIPWGDLPDWFERVQSIGNPVRRDLQLFILLTGLRATDAKTVRFEHVNLGDEPVQVGTVVIPPGCMHRPKPKGGEDRAFTVPVSKAVLEILRRRRDENHVLYGDDRGWAFPSTDMAGRVSHVAQPKEQRYDAEGRKVGYLPSPHRLRDTFATAAYQAGVRKLPLKVLMNHALAKGDDVTEDYIDPSDIDHLRVSAELIAAFLLERARKPSSERADGFGESEQVA
jgi:integrase